MTTSKGLLLIAISVAVLVGAGAVLAATGDLTPQGCNGDPDSPAGCSGTPQQGMDGAESVAVSADGRSVYVTANNDQAIVHYDRDPATGALTPKGCISDAVGGAPCGTTTPGLREPRSVAVSPDGKSVYVVSSEPGNTLVRFDRDTTEPDVGGLTPQGCVATAGDAVTCGALPSAQQAGLGGARTVAVSPDNRSVYVASSVDGAIVRFDRETTAGALSPAGCIEDPPVDVGCGVANEQEGLGGAFGVAVSPDNKSVYVASTQGDDAVVRFDRTTVDPVGTLTPQGCIEDPPADAGCAATQQGLDTARAVAVSPDNTSVYAIAESDVSVVHLSRTAGTGAIAPQGCIGAATGCTATTPALGNLRGLAVSPDATSVYVGNSAAISIFDRDPATGALTSKRCIGDVGTVGCGANAQGLAGAHGVAVSPDNASVYVTGFNDDAIVRFFRETGGATTPPTDPPVEEPPPPVSPPPSPPSKPLIGFINGIRVQVFINLPGSIKVEQRPGQNRTALAKTKKLLKPSSATAEAAGEVIVKLRLTKTGKKIYKEEGKLKLKVVVTFTATDGGGSSSTNGTLKLKQKK